MDVGRARDQGDEVQQVEAYAEAQSKEDADGLSSPPRGLHQQYGQWHEDGPQHVGEHRVNVGQRRSGCVRRLSTRHCCRRLCGPECLGPCASRRRDRGFSPSHEDEWTTRTAIIVDLPEPFSPTSPTTSPGCNTRSTPRSIGCRCDSGHIPRRNDFSVRRSR
jgi:hypothetical protein